MKRWMAGTAAFLLAVSCCTSAYAQKKKAVEPLLLDIPLYYQQDYPDNVVSWHGEERT